MQKRSQSNHTAPKKPPERNDPGACTRSGSTLGKAAGAQPRWSACCGPDTTTTTTFQTKLRGLPPRRFDRLRFGGLVHQARQRCDVIRDTPGLGFCGQLGGQSAGKLVFEIDMVELLPTIIANDKARRFVALSKSHHRIARALLRQIQHRDAPRVRH